MKEQVTINSLEFAQKSYEIRGTIAPRDLERLQDVLYSDRGRLEYHLQGAVNAAGKPGILLAVQGELELMCQRCMGALRHVVDTKVHLVVVSDESAMPMPNEEHDDEDYLVDNPRQNVVMLVEDEILLGVPMAPLHETAECGVDAAEAKEKKESPFKVLQGLKLGKR